MGLPDNLVFPLAFSNHSGTFPPSGDSHPSLMSERRFATTVSNYDYRPPVARRERCNSKLRYAHNVTRRYRYLDLLTLGFVVVLMISNLVGPKICQIGWLRPSAAEFLFPLTYICGDVFTEVYGYGASRRAIWLGFFAMALLAAMGQMAVALPPAPEWHGQEAYATVFGLVPRFAVASLVAYWAGEFTNSYTLAKLKLLTGGRWLWTRTVGSTVTGQAVDTAVVVVVAFAGTQPIPMILRMVLSSYLIKVAVEVVATPLTYFVVGRLKATEGVDVYDRNTDFSPFALQRENV
jgi:uncharacterized integral membrane protein (TIGR00697 family)